MPKDEIDKLAQIIWDYHHMNQQLEKADLIFVLGSHDTRVAEYAARLFLKGWAPYIIFSGGMAHKDDMLKTDWEKSEGEIFAEIAIKRGVPENMILIEREAENTGENITCSEKILRNKGIPYNKIIAVQKPYMERRTLATIKVYWPERELVVSSPPLTYETYPNVEISKKELINIMVGDLQRIIEYPKLGFQIPQEIPDFVLEAYNQLIKWGFDKHLIK